LTVLHNALRRVIATRRASCSWDVDHTNCTWVAMLHSLEEPEFSGRMLEESLALCLVWLMAKGTTRERGHGTGWDRFFPKLTNVAEQLSVLKKERRRSTADATLTACLDDGRLSRPIPGV
jgi:hypothetical protein